MKKVIFILSVLLTAGLFSCSVSEDDSTAYDYRMGDAHVREPAWEDLKASIESIGAEYEPSSQTRVGGIVRVWPLSVLYTDCAVGFCVYSLSNSVGLAVILGSLASERANEQFLFERLCQSSGGSNVPYYFSPTALDGLFFVPSVSRTAVDSVGYMHNKVILDINDGNNFTYNYIFSDSIYNDVMGYYAQGNSAIQQSLLSQFENDFTLHAVDASIKDALLNDSSANGIYNTLALFNGVNEDGLQTLYDYTERLYNLDDSQISDYTNKVLSTIENSDLRPQDIEELKVGVFIGFSSRKLWNGYYDSGNTN